MKFLTGLSRIFVGALFIISGLIKLNDPMGFSFKLEEYFSIGVLNLPFLEPLALAIALFVVIVEVILGVFLLLGFKPKFTVWSLLLMILFFTFLTWYSAYYNKVTDCGCFGDAIKLTPWESFTKDIILLVFILILLIGLKYIKPIFGNLFSTFLAALSLIGCIVFANHVMNHLPVIDFRPYKIGANIMDGMSIPEGAPEAVYEYAWKFNINGEENVIVTNGDYPDVNGEFVDVETKEIDPGYEPPIHDFTIEKGDIDFTTEFLEEAYLVMVISYDLDKSNRNAFKDVKEYTDRALEAGYKVIGMSASGDDEANEIENSYQLGFDFYFTDQTTLKTIVRSNPGILVLEKGTVIQKVHYNDLDELTFKQDIEKEEVIEESDPINQELKQKLDSVYALDQGVRAIYSASFKSEKDSIAKAIGLPVQPSDVAYMQQWFAVDSTNLEYIKEVIDEYGYPGKTLVGQPTNEAAWHVIQHSEAIDTYLDLIKETADQGELPMSLAAMMEDRYLMQQNKEQIYGTQGSTVIAGGKQINFIWPIQDLDSANIKRKEIFGTTVQDYGKELFGDNFEFKTYTLKQVDSLNNLN